MQATRIILATLVLTTLVLSGPGSAVASEAYAVLVNATGKVEIVRSGSSTPGSFGAGLEPGDVIRTGSEASAAVLYQSGELLQLAAGTEMVIDDAPGGEGFLAQVSGADVGGFAQTASSAEGLAALPTLRSGAGALTAVHPRNTLVREAKPEFAWTAVDEAFEYTLTLEGEGEAAGTYVTEAPSFRIDSRLPAGSEWMWTVEAMTDDGPVTSEPVVFRTATLEDGTGLVKLEMSLKDLLDAEDPARADAAAYVLASYCGSHGFYGEAIDRLEALAKRHPGNKELYRQLGSLYQATGRNDAAAMAYRKALDD